MEYCYHILIQTVDIFMKFNDNATEFSFNMKIVDDNNLQNVAFMPNTLIRDVRDFMSQFILYKYNQTIPVTFISVMDRHYH